MKANELQQVRPGFHDASAGSQAVFRSALSALSHPGRVIELPRVSGLPLHGHAAAAVLLQALVDSDCAVWLSPSLAATDAAAWLRFHTGCYWAASPATARFLWVAEADDLPDLAVLDAGTDEYPDQSATCVVEVSALGDPPADGACEQAPGMSPEMSPEQSARQSARQSPERSPELSPEQRLELQLEGPGIATRQTLWVQGLAADFGAQWHANHQRFPRGVDLFLATPTHLTGLPRTAHARVVSTPQER